MFCSSLIYQFSSSLPRVNRGEPGEAGLSFRNDLSRNSVIGRAQHSTHAARRARGFTLLETLVVIAIIALVAAVSRPLFTSGVSASQHRSAAREVAGMLRLARTEAVAKRTDIGVDFDLTARTVQIPSANNKRVTKIPDGIEINLTTTAAETRSETEASVRFYPDGGATGGRVTLKVRERSYWVDIDWLTGRVSIEENVL